MRGVSSPVHPPVIVLFHTEHVADPLTSPLNNSICKFRGRLHFTLLPCLPTPLCLQWRIAGCGMSYLLFIRELLLRQMKYQLRTLMIRVWRLTTSRNNGNAAYLGRVFWVPILHKCILCHVICELKSWTQRASPVDCARYLLKAGN